MGLVFLIRGRLPVACSAGQPSSLAAHGSSLHAIEGSALFAFSALTFVSVSFHFAPRVADGATVRSVVGFVGNVVVSFEEK